jgi:copper chaperone CopZ
VSAGIERISGVESVLVSLNRGVAEVKLKPGNTVHPERIHDVVRDKGFTPKQAKVVVHGDVTVAGGKLRFKVSGTDQVYDLQIDPKVGLSASEVQKRGDKILILEGVIPAPASGQGKFIRLIQIKTLP